jgi:ribosome-associated protein
MTDSDTIDDFEDFEDEDIDDIDAVDTLDSFDDSEDDEEYEDDDAVEIDEAPIQPILDADALTVARAIVDFISDKKGEKIILSDLRPVSVIAEFFVIGEAPSERQINSIVDHIREEVRKTFGVSPLRTEGIGSSGWVLLDYGDVIVHLFDPDVRTYYDLEGLWREAPILMRMQ